MSDTASDDGKAFRPITEAGYPGMKCPCGSDPLLFTVRDMSGWSQEATGHYLRCPSCGRYGGLANTIPEAFGRWNGRIAHDPIQSTEEPRA